MTAAAFILSPARLDGARAAMLLRPEASFELAVRLRGGRATIGEVYAFISGLYFRGKLTYATRFAAAGAIRVITSRGLVAPDLVVDVARLERERDGGIDLDDPLYRVALTADARRYADGREGPIVLLGSIATDRYVGPLLEALGARLCFPADFVGRGDNSRGGLLLRAVRAERELDYVPLRGAARNGARPPKLPRQRRA